MPLSALALVLLAAFCHATWNLLAKRTGGGVAFVWLFSFCSIIIYAPFAITLWWLQQPDFTATAVLFIITSASLHCGYYLSLQRGYSLGNLSLVYPLARGVGPMLATLLAIPLLAERPSTLALGGAGLIVVCIFIMTGGTEGLRHAHHNVRAATGFGLLTALFICGYTLVDKHAVSTLLIPPLLYDWFANAGRTLLLTPLVAGRRNEVATMWRKHRRAVMGVAVLSPLAYILVLSAMVFTPVSYVAPAREVSILIGTFMGARLLHERVGIARWVAATGMVFGLAFLALG